MNEKANCTNEPRDFWNAADFEDTVAAALIACFETKVRKNRGAAPADRLTDERMAMVREAGPYIASDSRFIVGPGWGAGRWSFDLVNDKLPMSGCYAIRPSGKVAESIPGAYLYMMHVRQVTALGKCWEKRRAGTLYEMLTVHTDGAGINGERRFFTVASDGAVWACDQRIQHDSRGPVMGAGRPVVGPDEAWLANTEAWGSVALQSLADRRFCWTISAQEKNTRAHLGCMQEEVKSLLYARSLPMTATGRKRPILHLVEAHKRRLKNGTDVDVTTFLRGQQVVEFGGTIFRVNPPAVLRTEVSKSSQTRFFELAP
ncbi:hypothetical protein AB4Y45_32530 [Paraburkholderia sp. EG287A]|uniref:hypothetical protein n=1 Tax=Paraburkholderia sp. EG287A TaxID=3237012 RepID=UPI0034D30741